MANLGAKTLKVPSVGTFTSSSLGFFSWATELRPPTANKQLISSRRIMVLFIMLSSSICHISYDIWLWHMKHELTSKASTLANETNRPRQSVLPQHHVGFDRLVHRFGINRQPDL